MDSQYRWFDFVSNNRLLEETYSKLVFGRQISTFGHVARLPAHMILSCGNPQGWSRGRGRPPATWLKQMEGYCRGVGTDRARAWTLAKEDVNAYRRMWRGTAEAPAPVVQAP